MMRTGVVRFPARVGNCPSYEEFRTRAYERLQAGIVHPLRMLARTQAEAEKARCALLRENLEKLLSGDWSGWESLDGVIVLGQDSAALSEAMRGEDLDAVVTLSLEVSEVDVRRNGNRFEHSARFHVRLAALREGGAVRTDSLRVQESSESFTDFGDVAQAAAKLARRPISLARSYFERPSVHRRARLLAVDSGTWAPTFVFVAGPGRIVPGRRFRVLGPDSLPLAWGIAWDRVAAGGRTWRGRQVGGGIPPIGSHLQEIPGDLGWRAGIALVPVGDALGGELRLGPRVPIGASLRVGVDLSLRAHEFRSVSPPDWVLGWGGGVGLEPDVSFQRNVRRWFFEAGVRTGLRWDAVALESSTGDRSTGATWARRGELIAALHAGVMFAVDPGSSVGISTSWDVFQGRGAWDAGQQRVANPSGAAAWRWEVQYHGWSRSL